MVRPSKGGKQVAVRLPEEEIAAIDEWVAEVRASGGIGTSGVTRSDLIRELVAKGLKERREVAQKGKAKR